MFGAGTGNSVGFQVLTAASMDMTTFWDIVPCCIVEVDGRFGSGFCLHHQGGHADNHTYLLLVL
jgi:hypothetical protein